MPLNEVEAGLRQENNNQHERTTEDKMDPNSFKSKALADPFPAPAGWREIISQN